jgi:copper chaperone CopZ
MTCGGCSKAVNAVLSKTEGSQFVNIRLKFTGVSNIQIDLAQQLVTVESTIPAEDVLKAIQKTGILFLLLIFTFRRQKSVDQAINKECIIQ